MATSPPIMVVGEAHCERKIQFQICEWAGEGGLGGTGEGAGGGRQRGQGGPGRGAEWAVEERE